MDEKPKFNNNISYWKDRYGKMSGERVVGNINWTEKEYNMEYERWRSYYVKIMKPADLILDFGCGIGRWSSFLSEYGSYHGCDIIDFPGKNFELIKDCIIPFGKTQFDLIWTCVVLQHIIDERLLENYIQQFHSRLKNNGRVIITENISDNRSNNYIMYRSLKDYVSLFKEAGFEKWDYMIFSSSNEDHVIIEFKKE